MFSTTTKVVVDGREFELATEGLIGRAVLAAAGGDPERLHVLIRIDGGRARLVAPNDVVESAGVTPSFRVHRSGGLHHLKVDGSTWEWGAPGIQEADIREIAGIPDERALFTANAGGAPLMRGGLVDLTRDTVPHIVSRELPPEQATVPVVINGAARELVTKAVTFEDLVGLAYPERSDLTTRMFTVTYRHGPADRPEGSVVPTQSIPVAPGAVFHVTATDKS